MGSVYDNMATPGFSRDLSGETQRMTKISSASLKGRKATAGKVLSRTQGALTQFARDIGSGALATRRDSRASILSETAERETYSQLAATGRKFKPVDSQRAQNEYTRMVRGEDGKLRSVKHGVVVEERFDRLNRPKDPSPKASTPTYASLDRRSQNQPGDDKSLELDSMRPNPAYARGETYDLMGPRESLALIQRTDVTSRERLQVVAEAFNYEGLPASRVAALPYGDSSKVALVPNEGKAKIEQPASQYTPYPNASKKTLPRLVNPQSAWLGYHDKFVAALQAKGQGLLKEANGALLVSGKAVDAALKSGLIKPGTGIFFRDTDDGKLKIFLKTGGGFERTLYHVTETNDRMLQVEHWSGAHKAEVYPVKDMRVLLEHFARQFEGIGSNNRGTTSIQVVESLPPPEELKEFTDPLAQVARPLPPIEFRGSLVDLFVANKRDGEVGVPYLSGTVIRDRMKVKDIPVGASIFFRDEDDRGRLRILVKTAKEPGYREFQVAREREQVTKGSGEKGKPTGRFIVFHKHAGTQTYTRRELDKFISFQRHVAEKKPDQRTFIPPAYRFGEA